MIDITITEDNHKELEQKMNEETKKAIKHFEHELVAIRTGRAHASLVEGIKVMPYPGQEMTLKAVAAISTPEARLILIQPWDASTIPHIEKAISNSELGMTPLSDGGVIRLQLPEMSTNRRTELVKILHKKLEECRVAIRNVRKDFNNFVRDAQRDKTISENTHRRLMDVIQKITDTAIKQAEDLSDKKEKDITTV